MEVISPSRAAPSADRLGVRGKVPVLCHSPLYTEVTGIVQGSQLSKHILASVICVCPSFSIYLTKRTVFDDSAHESLPLL